MSLLARLPHACACVPSALDKSYLINERLFEMFDESANPIFKIQCFNLSRVTFGYYMLLRVQCTCMYRVSSVCVPATQYNLHVCSGYQDCIKSVCPGSPR